MPLTWFSNPARLATLEGCAASWVGTPWRLNSSVRGPRGGVSCSRLAAAIYTTCDFLPAFDPPRDNLRALVLGLSQNLRDFFPTGIAARFTLLAPAEELLPGDLALFRENSSALHLGVVLANRRFVHVLRATGVCISSLDDSTYQSALVEALRPNP